MAGYIGNSRPLDSRWRLVASRDGFDRVCYSRRPEKGARFGTLVVVRPGTGNDSYTRCRCDCGLNYEINTRQLWRKQSVRCRSCGISKGALARRLYVGLFPNDAVQSLWTHRYTGIVSRCTNTACAAYKHYGARGITFHGPWLRNRKRFFKYASTLLGWDDLTLDIDRKDNDKGYVPGNIQLVPRQQNSANRRTTKWVSYRGERYPASVFCRKFCPNWKSLNALRWHLTRGRSAEWIVAKHDEARKGFRSPELRAE